MRQSDCRTPATLAEVARRLREIDATDPNAVAAALAGLALPAGFEVEAFGALVYESEAA